MAHRLTIAALAALLLADPADAHGLRVFAWVDGAEVVVESRFSTGARPHAAQVRVLDADGAEIRVLTAGPDGVARFPLDGAEGGLTLEVHVGDGHDGYWTLTPQDVARGNGVGGADRGGP